MFTPKKSINTVNKMMVFVSNVNDEGNDGSGPGKIITWLKTFQVFLGDFTALLMCLSQHDKEDFKAKMEAKEKLLNLNKLD